HSVAERDGRVTPRITRSSGGSDAVLRKATALAVAGVLSPRSGSLFAQEEENCAQASGARRANRTEAA
ncbi:MAG TPA: hypothetical protein VFZ03_01270, partial [Dongiaceae bacterium]